MATRPARKRAAPNFHRLPDEVAAQLLRALQSIPRPRDPLVLQRPEFPRPPTRRPEDDFNVILRGRQIGRIWRHEYEHDRKSGKGPWHWNWTGVKDRTDASGHGPTLESVMADFRRAWEGRTCERVVR